MLRQVLPLLLWTGLSAAAPPLLRASFDGSLEATGLAGKIVPEQVVGTATFQPGRFGQAHVGQLSCSAEDGSPGEEKRHFDIEDDEQQRHDIEADVELDPGCPDCRFAALVGRLLLRSRQLGSDQLADQQWRQNQSDASENKEKKVQQQVRHGTFRSRWQKVGNNDGSDQRPSDGANSNGLGSPLTQTG